MSSKKAKNLAQEIRAATEPQASRATPSLPGLPEMDAIKAKRASLPRRAISVDVATYALAQGIVRALAAQEGLLSLGEVVERGLVAYREKLGLKIPVETMGGKLRPGPRGGGGA